MSNSFWRVLIVVLAALLAVLVIPACCDDDDDDCNDYVCTADGTSYSCCGGCGSTGCTLSCNYCGNTCCGVGVCYGC